MKGHPGGEEHSRRMLKLSALPSGARVLDMGAGAGEMLQLLRTLGYSARGIDLAPRTSAVEKGDFLRTGYEDQSFDAVISQCAFIVSGDVSGALREAHRLIRPGGKLLLSDVFFASPGPMLEREGFSVLYAENMTAQWREYYLEALWREDAVCPIPQGKCEYWFLIGERR